MSTKRFLSAVLSIVMVLSLFVPAAAAPARHGEDYVRVETPVGVEPVHSHEAAPVSSTRDVPVIEDSAELFAVSHSVNFSDNPPYDSFFTVTGSTEDKTATDENGVSYTKGLKLSGNNDGVSFTATGADVMKAVILFQQSGKKVNWVEGSKSSAITSTAANQVMIVSKDLTEGVTYTLKKNNPNIWILAVSIEAAHVHTYSEDPADWTIDKAATCAEKGQKSTTCTVEGCTEKKTEEIDNATIPHTFTKWEVVTPATCEHVGSEKRVCAVCNTADTASGSTREIPLAAHTYKNGTSGICLICGKDSENGQVHSHTWAKPDGADNDGWVVTKAATCLAAGTKSRTCSNADCGKVETAVIAKLEHAYTGPGGVCVNGCGLVESAGKGDMTKEGGDLESAYIEWPIGAGVKKYEVFIKEFSAADSTYVKLNENLVREYPGYMRADALGLKAGIYQMKAVPDGNDSAKLVSGALTVLAHDRSGYAFADGNTPGAYKADGTLKDNAKVVYVTNENKDTVTVDGLLNKNGKTPDVTPTGISAIILNQKNNTKETPMVIRIIGCVEDPAGMPKGDLYVDDVDCGLTIEGVGNDAYANGWGIVLKGCSHVEVRNMGFINCNSSEGDDLGLQQDNEYIWVHNNDFFYGDAGSDADQVKGDGALDTKKSTYVTHAYNHFWDCGKCNLQGMKDEKETNYITYHHNWFDHSDSRHPRIRTCSVHIYNNYYDGNAKYGVGVTMGASAFVDSNYFRNTKYPMLISMQGNDVAGGNDGTFSSENGGVIKAYGNVMVGAKNFTPYAEDNVEFDAYVVDSRNATVPGTVKAKKGGTSYNNFDQNLPNGYYNVQPQSAADAMITTTEWAGRVEGGDFQWIFNNAVEDSNYAVIAGLKSALVGYETSLISVGGTVTQSADDLAGVPEHEHTPGSWKVTKVPGCDPSTQAVVNGEETQYCVTCGEVLGTRVVTGQHSNDGTGTCTVCGFATGNGGGAVTNGITLKASQFKMTAATTGQKSDELTDTDMEGKPEIYGYVGKVNKRLPKEDASFLGKSADFLELGSSGTGGITVNLTDDDVPASLNVKFGGPGKDQTANMRILKGTAINTATQVATTSYKGSSGGDSTLYSLDITEAGTYIIASTAGATYSTRLYEVIVTPPATATTHTHSWVWTIVTEPTCGKDGLKQGACAGCGNEQEQEIAATGNHTWSDWAADPDDDTKEVRTCSVCGEDEKRDASGPVVTPVAATGVSLDMTAVELTVGETADLVATVAPADADNKAVTWSSSAAGVASVSNGTVTAVAAGSAIITVTTADGGFTATCAVTVKAAASAGDTTPHTLQAGAVIEKVNNKNTVTTASAFGPITATAAVGDTVVAYKDAKEPDKSDANDEIPITAAEMTAIDSGYFSVTGDVNKRVGTADKTEGSNKIKVISGFTDVTCIEVKTQAASSIDFTVTGTATATVSFSSTGSKNWSALELQKKDGTDWVGVDATITAGENLKLFPESTSIILMYGTGTQSASFSGLTAGEYRLVTPNKGNGPTDPNDTSDNAAGLWTKNDGTTVDTKPSDTKLFPFTRNTRIMKIVVNETATAAGPVAATGVTLNKDTLSLAAGGSEKLTATVAPAEATDKTVSWTSSDTSVATVTADGTVTAVAAGTATITAATKNAKKATCAVTVTGGEGGGETAGKYTVTLKLSNLQCNNAPKQVNAGAKLQLKLSIVTSSYALPATISVKMGGASLNKSQYTYENDTGWLTIASVTGNVVVTASGTYKGSSTPISGSSGGSSAAPETPEAPTPATGTPFVDLKDNDWFYGSVKTAYDRGLMKGTDATHFTPAMNTSRAMVATVLFRLDGEKSGDVTGAFSDVASGQWYTQAIEWAAAAGVVQGFQDGTFAPDADVTREQLVVMLYRYADPTVLDKSDALGAFADAESVSAWAADALQWAVKAGIINGKGDNTLDPQGLATRAEVCTILVRFLDLKK